MIFNILIFKLINQLLMLDNNNKNACINKRLSVD